MPRRTPKSEYAKAGGDHTKIEPFKMAMVSAGKRTLTFPNKRGVQIEPESVGAHGVVFRYCGARPHFWCMTQEGLGNKNWIAEWMYQPRIGRQQPRLVQRILGLDVRELESVSRPFPGGVRRP